ncbi:MAG TPA: NAD(P)-dependent oxidoreductase, partial [Campylobacterales bacterium]|nr:NAD(P)-dependent oxidoreductase [Campylobacterales bacterium]
NAKGYSNAIFSGLTTLEIAKVIREYILPNESLCGLYHLSADAISKYDLLKIINKSYGCNIDIERFDDFYIDRSLDSSEFRKKTGYVPNSWEKLIGDMHDDYVSCKYYCGAREQQC